MFAGKKPSNKPKEVAQQEKKQELENRLRGVQEQLGQTVKKPSKKGMDAEEMFGFCKMMVGVHCFI